MLSRLPDVVFTGIPRKPSLAPSCEDDDRRMIRAYAGEPVESLGRGVAAHARIDDTIAIPGVVQLSLHDAGIIVGRIHPQSSGKTVAERHDRRTRIRRGLSAGGSFEARSAFLQPDPFSWERNCSSKE